MNPLLRPSPDDDVLDQAADWITALVCAEKISAVLPELNAWLNEKPAHRDAFREAQRAWRLAKPMLRAGQPGAGSAEVQAFFDALEEERVRCPQDFADA